MTLIRRTPWPVLAGLLLLAVVAFGAGIWSWVSLNDPPRLGTWTDSGAVQQILGDSLDPTSQETLLVVVGGTQFAYTLDPTEYGLPPQVEEGDYVTMWVATVREMVYSPY